MSATAPIKLNRADLRITTQSVEVRNPLYSDVVEYVQALNDLYEVSRFIADPQYNESRNLIRNHIATKYAELLNKIWREPAPGETVNKGPDALRSFDIEKSLEVRRFIESDLLDLNHTFYLDESYLQSLMKLGEEDKLRVSRVSLSSPLEITTIINAIPAAITAVWGIVQIVEKLANVKKVRLEVQKLERELAASAPSREGEEIDGDAEFSRRLQKSTPYEKAKYRQQAVRMREALIKVQEIKVEVVENE